MVRPGQQADDADPLFDEIDRGPMEFEPIAAAPVALENETPAIAQEQAGLVDRQAGRSRVAQSVASIARAAWSGSSAWVIGRPMTRIDAPWSSAWRGVMTRF